MVSTRQERLLSVKKVFPRMKVLLHEKYIETNFNVSNSAVNWVAMSTSDTWYIFTGGGGTADNRHSAVYMPESERRTRVLF